MYSEVLKPAVRGVSLVKQCVNVKAANDSVSVSPVWGSSPRVTARLILYRARQLQNYNSGIVLHSRAWTTATEESRTIQPSTGRDSAGLISPGHTGQPAAPDGHARAVIRPDPPMTAQIRGASHVSWSRDFLFWYMISSGGSTVCAEIQTLPLLTGYLSVNWSAGLWGRRPPLVSCWNWEGSSSSLTFSTALALYNGAI